MMSILGLAVLQVFLLAFATAENHHVLFLENRCTFPIWPTIRDGSFLTEDLPLSKYLPSLAPNSAPYQVVVPEPRWTGQIWARTGCNENGTHCETGTCADEKNEYCVPSSVTRAYFAFDGAFRGYAVNGSEYEVQLANGFNIPLVIIPGRYNNNVSSSCETVGCFSDLKSHCPSELAGRNSAGKVISCKSPCAVFKTEYYCSTGRYLFKLPTSDWSPKYKAVFKPSCPHVGNYFGKYKDYMRDPYSTTHKSCHDEGADRGQFTIRFC